MWFSNGIESLLVVCQVSVHDDESTHQNWLTSRVWGGPIGFESDAAFGNETEKGCV